MLFTRAGAPGPGRKHSDSLNCHYFAFSQFTVVLQYQMKTLVAWYISAARQELSLAIPKCYARSNYKMPPLIYTIDIK